ncbi:MAG: glycolate oxidase subunit GlcE [Alphaproteobacteria bacterium]
MAQVFRPENADQVREVVAWAAGEKSPIAVAGAGSKDGLGRPVECPNRLDTTRLSGVALYEPEELVISAQAGTPLAEIEATLKAGGQEMSFEPPDYGPLFGRPAGLGTIGAVFACNLSGPRRVKSGAARDFFLGAKAVSGRGESFKTGGRVMKNVTGYDMCKLLAGSYGTLAVMTEVTFKVLPLPSQTHTLLVLGLDDRAAVEAMTRALKSPFEVYGTVHWPREVAARSALAQVAGCGEAVTAVRIEGPPPSIRYCRGQLAALLGDAGTIDDLDEAASFAFWREARDVLPLADLNDRSVWRLSVVPSRGAEVVSDIRARLDAVAYYDWGGGLIWLAAAMPEGGAGGIEAVEKAVRGAVARAGGHALLVRASESDRRAVPVFQPLDAPKAALTLRLKDSFDPARVLNPGRMYSGM